MGNERASPSRAWSASLRLLSAFALRKRDSNMRLSLARSSESSELDSLTAGLSTVEASEGTTLAGRASGANGTGSSRSKSPSSDVRRASGTLCASAGSFLGGSARGRLRLAPLGLGGMSCARERAALVADMLPAAAPRWWSEPKGGGERIRRTRRGAHGAAAGQGFTVLKGRRALRVPTKAGRRGARRTRETARSSDRSRTAEADEMRSSGFRPGV
eukprot:scaffold385_cov305-Pinguiococcus_pyrenoidosus.AAC.52